MEVYVCARARACVLVCVCVCVCVAFLGFVSEATVYSYCTGL